MKTALRTLITFLTLSHSLALTWSRIGCDEAWSVERIDAQGGPMTIDADALWANAEELSTGARDAISSLRGFQARPSKARENAGASAKFIWNVGFSAHRGLASSSEGDMDEVTSLYSDVESALAGTLDLPSAQRGYLFCGGRGLTRGRVPGLRDNPVWYAEVIEGGEDGGQGTTDYIIPRVFESAQRQPCTERGDQAYLGKTFYGKKAGSGPEEDVIGVVLCPNQYKEGGLRAYATLDKGYTAEALDGNKRPYVAHYNSLSGTLLHEMVHVVGHARDPTPPPAGGYHDYASGFREQYRLAQAGPRDRKLHNPDGYRLFAEMCQSPSTAWGYPDQPPA